jgi:hypothetical protein
MKEIVIKVPYCDKCPFLKEKEKINCVVLACSLAGWEEGQDMNLVNYTGIRPKGICPPEECLLKRNDVKISLI